MLKHLIEQWLGEEEKYWEKHSDGNYKDGAIEALTALKSRIPELEEMILGEIEKYNRSNSDTPSKAESWSNNGFESIVQDIINTLKGGKE